MPIMGFMSCSCHSQQENTKSNSRNPIQFFLFMNKISQKQPKMLAKWADIATLTPHGSQDNLQMILKTVWYIHLTTYNVLIFFQEPQFLRNFYIGYQSTSIRAFSTQIKEYKLTHKICIWSQNHISTSNWHTEMADLSKFLSLDY